MDHNLGALLYHSIKSGDVAKVNQLLDKGASINSYYEGSTPLAWAIKCRQPEVAKHLLCRKADPHQGWRDFRQGEVRHLPPLFLAVHGGFTNVTDKLLEVGADINAADDRTNQCALHVCTQMNHHDILNLLLRRGININRVDYDSNTALHLAVIQGNKASVELLLSLNASVNIPDNEDRIPLHLACMNETEDKEMVRMLLEAGSMINGKDSHGRTPIYCATNMGHTDIVDMLLDHGSATCDVDHEDKTPLFQACSRGHAKIAEMLVVKGHADINRECGVFRTRCRPIQMAAKLGHEEIVTMLIDQGANVHLCDSVNYENVLFSACKAGLINIVELLLKECKVDVNSCSAIGNNPLHEAVWAYTGPEGNVAGIIRKLLGAGVDVNKLNSTNSTPLILACGLSSGDRNLELVQLLVNNDAHLDYVSHSQGTALIKAVSAQNFQSAKLLLEKGCQLDLVGNGRHSALHVAISLGHPAAYQLARLLVQHGASVECMIGEGLQPLDLVCADEEHLATLSEASAQYKLIECLLQAGAKLKIQEHSSPYDRLQRSKNPKLCSLLDMYQLAPLYVHCIQLVRTVLLAHVGGRSLWSATDKLPIPDSIKNDVKLVIE